MIHARVLHEHKATFLFWRGWSQRDMFGWQTGCVVVNFGILGGERAGHSSYQRK